MVINENQIEQLNAYLNEGIVLQNSAIEGKKKYLIELQKWFSVICEDNKLFVPSWVMTLTTGPVEVSNVDSSPQTEFVDNRLLLCIQLLTDIRTNYFLQKQLDESKKQTHEIEKQTRLSKRAFRMSICAVVVSIVAVLVSTWATYVSTMPHTIIFDQNHYEKMYNILSNDSIGR